jgi:hypothetical protein
MFNSKHEENEIDDEFETEAAVVQQEVNQNDELSEEDWLVSWVKIESGGSQALGFSTDNKKRKMIKKDFGSGPVKAMVFMVTTPDEPDVEKEFRVTSKNLARQILSYLKRGITDLQITRHGKGKFDTKYELTPLGEAAPLPKAQKRL